MVDGIDGDAKESGAYRDDDAFKSMPYYAEYSRLLGASAQALESVETSSDILDIHTARQIVNPDARYEPGGQYFVVADAMFAIDDINSNTENDPFELGVTIGQEVVVGARNAKDLFLGYLHAAYSFDVMKVGMVGPKDIIKDAQEFGAIKYLQATILDKLESTEANIKVLQTYLDSVSSLAKKDTFFGWVYVKAESFINDFNNITNIRNIASRMEVSEDSDGTIDGMTNEVVAAAMKQRKYGIKSSYTESSLGGSWLFYEAEDFMAGANQKGWDQELFPQVAQIFHTAKTSFTSLKVQSEVVDVGNGGIQSRIRGHLEEVDMFLYIGKDGQIAFDVEELYTLDVILRDMPQQKQAMRAEIMSKFFDLTMPIQGKKRLPSGHVKSPEVEDKEHDPILKMLVPRIKRLKEKTDPQSDVKREVRKHGVVLHVRELPDGFHPSPEARQKAEALGIELAENETIVKAHVRGAGNPVEGHRAVKRLIENVVTQ